MQRKRTTTHAHNVLPLAVAFCVVLRAEKREMFPSQWPSHSINSLWNHAERTTKKKKKKNRKSANDAGKAKHYKSSAS